MDVAIQHDVAMDDLVELFERKPETGLVGIGGGGAGQLELTSACPLVDMAHCMAGKKKRKKGRQNVKRHWKPSLGRFVEFYDRTGEHARRTEKAAGRSVEAQTQTQTRPTAEPRMGRRLLISVCAFVVMLGVIGGFRLARPRHVVVEYDVLVAAKPVAAKIDHGSATRVVTATATELKELVRDAVGLVRSTAAEHPNRLIVIELVAPVISFDSLRATDQHAVQRAATTLSGRPGADAAHLYESSVARFLDRVVTAAANPRVSVLGLPAEPGAAGIEAARRTNRRYDDVLKRLDHLVTAHIFFRTESWVTEQRMVEEAIPEALHRAAGRPIVFRLNLEWRVLIDRAEVGRYRRAAWNTLTDS